MVPLTHRLLLGGLQASLLLRRHRQALWGFGDEPGPEPGPSPAPAPPPSPDDPGDDPEGLPDDLVLPFVLLACFLVAMAGLMSGLTLGLMSLDQVDIEILRRSGTERQKRLAQRIQPMLARPHVLLVTLLVCNALAAEALPLVLDRLADPATAILVSVTVVLFFGEIIPQAACSRYGLQIGAYSAPFVKFLMVLTAPISYPVGWVLDLVLGHRHTALFRRAELKALVDIHTEGEFGGKLSPDEVAIIKGALDLSHKTARHAMTPIDMVFMLPSDALLDEATLTAIMASGHSRVPVHRPGDRGAIVGIMLTKELLMVNKDAPPAVGHLKVRSVPCVRADTPLYDMLKLFEVGRSHMAVLMQLKKEAAERQRKESEAQLMVEVDSMSDDPSLDGSEGAGELESRPTASLEDFLFDPKDFEPVGIITIEDVLEELLQAEILDETDQWVDNMQSTPISQAFLLRNLPPHLRPVLAARSLLPRIGGAAFMHPVAAGQGPAAAAPHSRPQSAGAPAGAAKQTAAAAAGAGAHKGSEVAASASAGAEEHGNGAAAANGTKPVAKPGLRPPLSPRSAAASGSRPPSGRGRSVGGSGATTPPGGGSVHAGLLYRQGSVGAALVAEALRQEIAEQLAAAAAAQQGGRAGLAARGRSRSLSPLPDRRSGHAGTARWTSPEGLALPAAFPAADGAAGQQQQARQQGSSASPAADGQQQQEQQPLPPLFPGLRRLGSSRSTPPSSGTSTPRMVVPLPPPPPRRSANLTNRVQQQMDLLQPLLEQRSAEHSQRRASMDG